MIMNKDYDSQNYRKTLGGDGQEQRATYREGSFSRKKKGGHGVSIYDRDVRRLLALRQYIRRIRKCCPSLIFWTKSLSMKMPSSTQMP